MEDVLTPGRGGRGERLRAAKTAFAVHDYAALATLVPVLEADATDPEVRHLLYRWDVAVDDLERFAARLAEREEEGVADLADRLGRGRLEVLCLHPRRARRTFEAALAEAGDDRGRARALHGLGMALYHVRDFDAALERLLAARELAPRDPEVLVGVAETRIRLGHVEEAIRAAEEALEHEPLHEQAHYLLGNGYARRDYSQLEAAWGDVLAEASRAVEEGSRAWSEGRLKEARASFLAALELCPELGRAHNGLAKTVQAERLLYDVHRSSYEELFAARDEPEVPAIERFVVNWSTLSPRQRKRSALSIAPWRRYVEVLLEAGATHYVKPLHQRLSEAPGQDLMRDQRIDYDSRLWDDVRGCGGYHTVTGVEDVELTVLGGYNTMLHELTHQVHQVLPSAWQRRIRELYRRAKARDAEDGEAFVSRYAGESVWEYFAEGANALATPRRDAWDRREIVRERLEERDPELVELVRELMEEADLGPVWAMAWTRRGDEELRHGRAEEATVAYRRAYERAPEEEAVCSSLVFGLEVSGRSAEARELASEAASADPRSGALARLRAETLWLAGGGLGEAVRGLERARAEVRREDLLEVDLTLGFLLWTTGEAEASLLAYERVLAEQSDHPLGLWGWAAAAAFLGDHAAAWRRYEEAARRRSGLAELRASFARDLVAAGELERARRELDAALLVDPEEPEALAAVAWLRLAEDRVEEAAATARRVLGQAPWCDLARLAAARAARRAGRGGEARELLQPWDERRRRAAPPRYVYLPRPGRWRLVETRPAVLRRFFDPLALEVGAGVSDG